MEIDKLIPSVDCNFIRLLVEEQIFIQLKLNAVESLV